MVMVLPAADFMTTYLILQCPDKYNPLECLKKFNIKSTQKREELIRQNDEFVAIG
jgi:hypothetical protein